MNILSLLFQNPKCCLWSVILFSYSFALLAGILSGAWGGGGFCCYRAWQLKTLCGSDLLWPLSHNPFCFDGLNTGVNKWHLVASRSSLSYAQRSLCLPAVSCQYGCMLTVHFYQQRTDMSIDPRPPEHVHRNRWRAPKIQCVLTLAELYLFRLDTLCSELNDTSLHMMIGAQSVECI